MTLEELQQVRINRNRLQDIVREHNLTAARGLVEHFPPGVQILDTKKTNFIKAVKMYCSHLLRLGITASLMECKLAVEEMP
jgi:hypothetical protein